MVYGSICVALTCVITDFPRIQMSKHAIYSHCRRVKSYPFRHQISLLRSTIACDHIDLLRAAPVLLRPARSGQLRIIRPQFGAM
jgi:hypothetical protein